MDDLYDLTLHLHYLLFLASKLPFKCDVHGPHSQINTEPSSSHGVCPAFGFFLPAKYTTHLLSCTCATKEASRFRGGGVWSIFGFIIKHRLGIKRIVPCSFGNKCINPCIRYLLFKHSVKLGDMGGCGNYKEFSQDI